MSFLNYSLFPFCLPFFFHSQITQLNIEMSNLQLADGETARDMVSERERTMSKSLQQRCVSPLLHLLIVILSMQVSMTSDFLK